MKTQAEKDYMTFITNTKYYKHTGDNDAHELGYLLLGLAGETGEVVEVFKKMVRAIGFLEGQNFNELVKNNGPVRKELVNELGDVLYYLVSILDFLGGDLETLMVTNTHKLWQRISDSPHSHLRGDIWPFDEPRLSLENVERHIREENL